MGDIGALFQFIKGQILEEDLISVEYLDFSDIETISRNTGITLPTPEQMQDVAYFLGEDISSFYICNKCLTPFNYFNPETMVFINIHTYDQSYLEMFHIKQRIEVQNKYMNEALQAKDYSRVFCLADGQLKVLAYKTLYDEIPDNQKYELFKQVYTSIDYGFDLFGYELVKDVLQYVPKKVRNKAIKNLELDKRGTITIYRGSNSQSTPPNKALSWTTDEEVAEFFANRFNKGNGVIYKAKVKVMNIVDYIEDRNEQEILVLPENLEDIQEVG